MSKDELIGLLLAELKSTRMQLVKCSKLLNEACDMLCDKAKDVAQKNWERRG